MRWLEREGGGQEKKKDRKEKKEMGNLKKRARVKAQKNKKTSDQ